jgi:hypothetical protein
MHTSSIKREYSEKTKLTSRRSCNDINTHKAVQNWAQKPMPKTNKEWENGPKKNEDTWVAALARVFLAASSGPSPVMGFAMMSLLKIST